MRAYSLLTVLIVGFGVVAFFAFPSGAAEKPDREEIAKLVEQLGNGSFAEREKATEMLDAIGGPALEPLRNAIKEGDAEVQRRGEELIKKIEKRVEADNVLKPKTISLKFKDTPLNEAVDTINKKTGYSIQLHDPQRKLVNRRVTLEIGETSFWQAFDQFCEKAEVVEGNAQDLANQPIGAAKGGPGAGPNAPAIRVYRGPGGMAAPSTNQITLIDGVPKNEGTFYAGAVRIRSLVGSKAQPDGVMPAARPEGELELPLQISPEPKLAWHGIARVRIDRAVDDFNQELVQETPQNDPNGDGTVEFINGGGGVIMRGSTRRMSYPGFPGAGSTQTGVRFKKGNKSSKSLREVKGVLAVVAQAEAQTLLTVDKVIKSSADDVFEFGDGGKVKVLKVAKNDEGQVDLQVELTVPTGVIPAGTPIRAGRAMRAGGGAVFDTFKVSHGNSPPTGSAKEATNGGYGGLNLLDDKGHAIPCVANSATFERLPDRTMRQVLAISFKGTKEQADVAKLVFNGSRQVTIEIPFELKNVPLQ